MKVTNYALFAMVLALGAPAAVAANRVDVDKPGTVDHPLVSRYAGSTLYLYGEENYGAVRMLAAEGGTPVERVVEGKVSNRMYFGPPGRTPVEIYRNYQAAFRTAGYEIVYECDFAKCDEQNTQRKMSNWAVKNTWADDGQSDPYILRIFQARPKFHYMHVKKQGAGGTTHIQVAVGAANTDGPDAGRAQQLVQVVEPSQVELGKVTVDAQTITNTLKSQGRIALYGVLFDTSQAVIKPESADTLAEMAKALKNDRALDVYIVGHTDNVGGIDANMALAKKRAQAVVEALSTRYGIAASRLQAFGVASLSPTAPNSNDEGRARNRRVEMVAR